MNYPMFNQAIYDEALAHFDKSDKPFYNLLKKHGLLNDMPNYPIFVNMVRCILTQKVYLRKSNKVRAKLTERLTNNFKPSDLIALGVETLVQYGAERKIAEIAIRFAEHCLNNRFETLDDILQLDIKGIGVWTKNVTAVTFSLTPSYPGYPYNSLTTGDPVVRKGIWVLHGIEAYNSYIMELNEKHKPWGGLLTWYLWREFNHKSIPVPRSYVYWDKESVNPNKESTYHEVIVVDTFDKNTKIYDFFTKVNLHYVKI